MSAAKICPLYKGSADVVNEGNAGLYYDKFFDGWTSAWSREEGSKNEWIKKIASRPARDAKLLDEYGRRIAQLAWQRHGDAWIYKTEERFVTGMGRSHPVENGFAWHPTLGVPYLPGSSIKGLLGQDNRKDLLGCEKHAGRVILLDAIPIQPVALEMDVMTPHYLPWSAENPPSDWRSPTPIPFLTVKPGALLLFAALPRCEQNSGDIATVNRWLREALDNAGAGAKTAVGYGRMKLATGADAQRLENLKREAEQARKGRLEKERLAHMDPLDRELAEIASSSKDPNQKSWNLWLKDLQQGHWCDADQAKSVAKRIRAAMEADGSWKTESRSKNPAKDHAHQTTLSVLKYLGPAQ